MNTKSIVFLLVLVIVAVTVVNETLTALFKTNFNIEYPFDPQELFVFALI
ncbi:Chloride channel protein 2-like 8, partial [Homarus americanus]